MTKTITMMSPYAKKFNKGVSEHSVSSPLGMWLLLALVAERGDELPEGVASALEKRLGVPLLDAVAQSRRIFIDPPDSLKAAVGAWSNGPLSDSYAHWSEPIQDMALVSHSIPSQGALDEWMKEKTEGIFPKSPVEVNDATDLLLASVLASKVSWNQSLSPCLPVGSMRRWGVNKVLRSAPEHPVFVAKVEGKTYGVHIATSNDALRVYSVVAVDDDVLPEEVMAASYDIAQEKYEPVDGIAEAINRKGSVILSVGQSSDRTPSAFLPAWSAETSLDLKEDVPESGAKEILEVLAARDVRGSSDVRQAAKASYTQHGFEAAAVTTVSIMRSAAFTTHPKLTVSFSRPYAVLAVAQSQEDLVPAFNAWVAEASEDESEDSESR